MRGRLITFEGLDGTGKSTQQRRLAETLRARGHEVICAREPTAGPAGQRLRRLAAQGVRLPAEEELALFVEDRRAHAAAVVEPALARGAHVLLDRYYHSTIAYQGARGLDPAAVRAANEAFARVPDRIYLLELEVADSLARVAGRGTPDAFEQREKLTRVAAGYDALDDPCILRLQASAPIDTLAKAIYADALAVIEAAS